MTKEEMALDKEIAELKEETRNILRQIEELEEERRQKKEEDTREEMKEGIANIKILIDEMEKQGFSRRDAMLFLTSVVTKGVK
jgi:hypothetical protein